ncbi:hypothetical protein ACVW0Y_001431 [Pseudomonas sp. TE3786]
MSNTSKVPFYPCGDSRHALFAVRAGIPLADALDSAHALLTAAQTLALHITNAPTRQQEPVSHACHFMIGAANATLQACIDGVPGEEAA